VLRLPLSLERFVFCPEQFFLKVSPESFALVVKILNRNKQDRMTLRIVRQGKNDPQVFGLTKYNFHGPYDKKWHISIFP